jgi:hypothetical protein
VEFIATIQQKISVKAEDRESAEQILRKHPPYIGVFGGDWSIETKSKITRIISLKKIRTN